MNRAAPSLGTLRAEGEGRYCLGGDMTIASVPALRSAGLQAFSHGSGAVEVDLSGVERADSGGLALLIDWLAWARAAGRTIRFSALPAALLALARLSNVEDLLVS
jgi:phospholipid transport system transporter-binding protein